MVDFLAVPKMRDCVPGVAPVSTNERGSRRTFPHSPRPAPLPGPAGENVPPPSRLPGPTGASPSTRPDLLHALCKAASVLSHPDYGAASRAKRSNRRSSSRLPPQARLKGPGSDRMIG